MQIIKKIISPVIITTLLSTSAIVGISSVHAAGGGGGGGSVGGGPSQSAPRYDASAEYQKGLAALQSKDYKLAVTSFRRSLSAAPRNAAGHYFLGVSYMGQESFKKASKSFAKAIRYDANMIDAHRDLAISYHKIEKTDKAQKVLSDLVSLQERCAGTCSDDAKLTNAISTVKSTISGDQASINSIDGSGLASVDGDKVYVAAVALINEKNYDAAIAELQIASQKFGPHPDVLTYLGFANRKLKNFDIAETYYKSALAVAPDHLGANEYFGELMIERGDIAGAKAQLAKLDSLCTFGCYEAEELRRWINAASIS